MNKKYHFASDTCFLTMTLDHSYCRNEDSEDSESYSSTEILGEDHLGATRPTPLQYTFPTRTTVLTACSLKETVLYKE
jgi:hypothetical protein